MKDLIKSVGPAIIVAAVVLGPGSILTSSKVGASFGLIGLPVIVAAAILMIAMVALAARLGVVYENSVCQELTRRLGKPATIFIGATLFVLVAFFQSSNNLALIGGLEPMLLGDSGEEFGFPIRALVLVLTNAFVIACLYLLRNLYTFIEKGMKILIGLMSLAFLVNVVVVFIKPRGFEPVPSTSSPELLPLLAMIGTTFSVGGAFYQAYLVREKGWTVADAHKGMIDSMVSISVLAVVTIIILLTSWRVFHGHPNPVDFKSVGDVAIQLEPAFGSVGRIVFCLGILAGALSSFLVNAMIGGTVMSDAIGKGARIEDRWPVHMTVAALATGGLVAIASLAKEGSTVHLITLAQALTVLGIPALAAALIYLGTRPELEGDRKVPKTILVLAIIGFCVSCVLAALTAQKVYNKLNPPQPKESRIPPSSPDEDFFRA